MYWNPPREAFTIPILGHPVMWYGVLFALGFALAYYLLLSVFKTALKREPPSPPWTPSSLSFHLVDRLLWYVVLGTLIGARLGNALFYEPDYFLQNPLEIFLVWHGGLASHGGAIGVLLAIALFTRKYRLLLPGKAFLPFFDLFTLPIPIVAAFIRFGNFMNQEILGTPTDLPWAVTFGNPAGHAAIVPRHPVMLYEAAAYLAIFVLCFTLWKKWGPSLKPGFLAGLFLTLLFSVRFLLEFTKVQQAAFTLIPGLDMGQILSIPFILWGLVLLITPKKPVLIN